VTKGNGSARAARPPGRRAPAPRLELRGSSASPEEAAAVMAAVEQFLRDTAPPPAPAQARPSGWLTTARREAVDREPERPVW
jgi:hypothetical protein